ncbi:MAG: Uma2 family endonuclease [Planctomycetes bacterium]|nr:Uma2 family endonuclease [Planctomycetota bacterium]
MATKTATRMTAEEFMERLDEFWPAELVDGRVVRIPEEVWSMANGGKHGLVRNRIGSLIDRYLEKHRIGYVFQNTGSRTRQKPDKLRFPDVSFYSNERIPAGGIPDRNFPVAPDLAVEVVSPSDTWQGLMERVEEFLAAGTKSCWVVDPGLRRVTVLRKGKAAERLGPGDKIAKEPALPGFEVDVGKFFEGL